MYARKPSPRWSVSPNEVFVTVSDAFDPLIVRRKSRCCIFSLRRLYFCRCTKTTRSGLCLALSGIRLCQWVSEHVGSNAEERFQQIRRYSMPIVRILARKTRSTRWVKRASRSSCSSHQLSSFVFQSILSTSDQCPTDHGQCFARSQTILSRRSEGIESGEKEKETRWYL